MTTWDHIYGHEWAVELLRDNVAHDRIGHATLITGPAAIGKTTLARTLAQALNCQADPPGDRPCGHCRACKLIGADRHPDVPLVEPTLTPRGQPVLKIDQIRELQQMLTLTAHEARFKVAIVADFDAANLSAANAFLKTLEEPPRHVKLILTAGDADSLLATIRSRCRLLQLRPLPTTTIARVLRDEHGVSAEESERLAHLAQGRPGWALRAAADPALLDAREAALAQLSDALAGDRVARFALAEQLARAGERLPAVLRTWLGWWRDVVLLQHEQGEGRLVNVDVRGDLAAAAQRLPPGQGLDALRQTRQALWQLERNANHRLVVERLLLAYPLPPGHA